MRAYFSIVRVKFLNGLQYRAAALAGIATQFAWGGLLVLLYKAFYEVNPDKFPMTLQQTASYIWLQQALLALFMTWMTDNEIFQNITDGNVAYELARPMDIYAIWYARNIGLRLSRAVLRCLPILIFAALLPAPYGLIMPSLNAQFACFILSAALAMHIVVAFNMLCYIITFYTISAQGVRIIFQTATDILSGSLLPIPFMPHAVQRILKLLPFGYMQDVPLRIYSGSIAGADMAWQLGGQVFWLAALVIGGWLWMRQATARVVVQGG